MTHNEEKKQSMDTNPEFDRGDIINRDIKTSVIIIFHIFKRLKESLNMLNITFEIQNKRAKIKFLEMDNILSEMLSHRMGLKAD